MSQLIVSMTGHSHFGDGLTVISTAFCSFYLLSNGANGVNFAQLSILAAVCAPYPSTIKKLPNGAMGDPDYTTSDWYKR